MHDDFYQMYLEEIKDIVPCTKEEQEKLLKEIAKGKEDAKTRLIEGNLQVTLEYAKEYEGKGVLLTDLIQEANMAFMMAIDDYRVVEDGQEFDSFASQKIRKALEVTVKEQEFAEQTGEELTARVNVLQTVSQVLSKELGREATVEELADKMKMSVQEIKNIMKMAMDAMSMNAENADLEALAGAEGMELIMDKDGTI